MYSWTLANVRSSQHFFHLSNDTRSVCIVSICAQRVVLFAAQSLSADVAFLFSNGLANILPQSTFNMNMVAATVRRTVSDSFHGECTILTQISLLSSSEHSTWRLLDRLEVDLLIRLRMNPQFDLQAFPTLEAQSDWEPRVKYDPYSSKQNDRSTRRCFTSNGYRFLSFCLHDLLRDPHISSSSWNNISIEFLIELYASQR